MKPSIPALTLITLAAGLSSASGQSPTPFQYGIEIGSPADLTIDSFATGTGRGAELYSYNAGMVLYSAKPESAPGNFDGGITLYGRPLSFVLAADYDPVNATVGTFDVWKLNDYWSAGTPVFRIDTAANSAAFNNVNVTISGGTLSVGGSPVLTSAAASAVYLTPAQANASYPLITALPKYGVDGTNFDRANGSATFGNNSYALGINNFTAGAARVGRDNGLSWPGSGTSSNATTPIPFNNFKNNAAFGSSRMGNTASSWSSTGSFKGTEKIENNLTCGAAMMGVFQGASVYNSLVSGSSYLLVEPGIFSTTPQTGVNMLGNTSVSLVGNARASNSLVTGSSTVNLWHETQNTQSANVGSADNIAVLGGSAISMINQYTTASPNSDYVTVGGNSKSLAVSQRSVTYSTAFGKSMIYTGDYGFGYSSSAPGAAYFPGTDRWTNVFPRMATTYGFAAGESVVANGTHGTALGKARVYADFGTAIGEGVDAGTAGTSVTGRYNKLQQYTYTANQEGTMQQFVVGNGTGDADADRSNALVVERAGLTTLTNKSWKANVNANPGTELQDPPSPTNNDRGGDALTVEGHTRLKGKVLIQPQGDLSMGGFSAGEMP